MAADYVDQVANGIIDQLRKGTASWVRPWEPGEQFMPYNPTTGNEYRGGNALWLMSQAESRGYDDARWLTYRQAQEQGAQVRKGEKGTPIQFWKWQGLEPVRDAQGKPMLDGEGNPVRELVRYERPRVLSAVVFNAQQIDGLPPAPDRPALPEWERHERAERILAGSGVDLRHVSGDRAFYRLSEDRITLPERGQFATGDRYYATALHELGHATGHPSRLDRDMAHPFGSEGYAREELRAEIGSLMLGGQLGIGHDPSQHVAYIGSWIKALEQDPREVFRAAADAEKIVKMVRSFEVERVQETGQAQGQEQSTPRVEASAPVQVAPPVMIQASHPAMTPSDERTYLAVPYAGKDAAKQVGARWDKTEKAWFVPAGVSVDAFTQWMPAKGSVHIDAGPHPRDTFADALHSAGLRVGGAPLMDGQLHRVPVEGDRGRERSGAYKGHLDGRPAGFYQNFKTGGEKVYWKANSQATALTAQERAQQAAEATQNRHDRTHQREQMYERAAGLADAIWEAAAPVSQSAYLQSKGVAAEGVREGRYGQHITVRGEDGGERKKSIAGMLIVPVHGADGKLASLQLIQPDGAKMFLPNGRMDTGHFAVGDVNKPGPLLIAEGYATAATVHELTGAPVVVAFNAGNLGKVAELYRAQHPKRAIYIAGDTDREKVSNVGRTKAEKAAAAIGGKALFPVFPDGAKGTDWNDLAKAVGRDTTQILLQAAIRVADRQLGAERSVQGNMPGRPGEHSMAATIQQVPSKQPARETADLER